MITIDTNEDLNLYGLGNGVFVCISGTHVRQLVGQSPMQTSLRATMGSNPGDLSVSISVKLQGYLTRWV
jgi:hypothetical protein